MTDTVHVTVDEIADDLGGGPWWLAHDHPERPPDSWVVWSWDCDPCVLHLIAAAHTEGHHPARTIVAAVDGALAERRDWQLTTNDVLAQARAWRAEHGLRPL